MFCGAESSNLDSANFHKKKKSWFSYGTPPLSAEKKPDFDKPFSASPLLFDLQLQLQLQQRRRWRPQFQLYPSPTSRYNETLIGKVEAVICEFIEFQG